MSAELRAALEQIAEATPLPPLNALVLGEHSAAFAERLQNIARAALASTSIDGVSVKPLPVTDPDDDAPDGTVMTFVRTRGSWEPIDGVSGTGLDVLAELRSEITAIAMESVPRETGHGAIRYKRAVIKRLDFFVARLAAGAALAKDGEEGGGGR